MEKCDVKIETFCFEHVISEEIKHEVDAEQDECQNFVENVDVNPELYPMISVKLENEELLDSAEEEQDEKIFAPNIHETSDDDQDESSEDTVHAQSNASDNTSPRKSTTIRDLYNFFTRDSQHFKCNFCFQLFSEESSLLAHACRDNMQGEPFGCSTLFSVPSNHIINHKKRFKCNQCSNSFTLYSNLKRHLRRHMNEKPFTCDYCKKSFTEKSEVRDHIFFVHVNDKPFKCDFCTKSFSAEYILKKHSRNHEEQNPCRCDECHRTFYSKQNLMQHMRTHTKEKPFKCNYCFRSFARKAAVLYHVNTHKNVKDDRLFVCPTCKKPFSSNTNLEKHTREVHTNKKMVICSLCSKPVTRKYIKQHLKRVHSMEKYLE